MTATASDRFTELHRVDEQFRAAAPLPEVVAAIGRPDVSLRTVLTTVMTAYADRPALGTRVTELAVDPGTGRTTARLLPRFDTMTYGELWRRAGAVAAAWHDDHDVPVRAGDFVATLGFASADYVAIDLACTRAAAVSLPLQTTASTAQLQPIVEETGAAVLAASTADLDAAVDLALACAGLRKIMVFDHHPGLTGDRERVEAARARLSDRRVVLELFADVVTRGGELPVPRPDDNPDGDRLTLVVYTSGSTGTPKGAMFTERMVAEQWRGFFHDHKELPLFGICYLPLSHGGGRGAMFGVLGQGGTCYFLARRDLSTLFEDFALARPTELILVPRICDLLFQRYQSEVDARVSAGADQAGAEAEALLEVRENVLGGRVLWAVFAGAPLAADRWAFVESVFGVPLHEVYASTEVASMVVFDRRVLRSQVIDYKLEDVPELGYFGTDEPHPRGQLLLKMTTMFPGYFKRPEITAEVFDEDGFYRTGDIMAQLGPDELRYLDRTNNVLKLSQGEFVTVARLEALFAASPAVGQIYVYGNGERSYLLAVVVPAPATLARTGGDLLRARTFVLEELHRIARAERLLPYEIPRDVLIEPEPFSTANGLLSVLQKPRRLQLKQHYGPMLERRYAELADRETADLRQLREDAAGRPVAETVVAAARSVLGSVFDGLSGETRFTDLGGDSLTAVALSTRLQAIFDVEVPVAVVISPATDLRALAGYVERQLTPGARRITASAVHGEDATEVRAADLTLDRFLDEATLAAATALPPPGGAARTVLLTGATGFLGRFLCLEWLARLAEVDGRLICLVRGEDAVTARARLDAVFDSGDPALVRDYRALAAGRLEVLAGDLGEPGLGLDAETWRRLADTVDLVVHPGALVNHVLPYDQLFGPNVAGTAELVKLAITTKLKPFTYVSTGGLLIGQAEDAPETADIRAVNPVRPLDDGYANGYAVSKWAGEVLLREAHEQCGLPVATLRSNAILAHRTYTGQLNVPDQLSRLLLSVLGTGLAPASFHTAGATAHYDGLPVDFIARVVTALAAGAETGHEVYNVRNPHGDGHSLDTFVDWLAEAGHPIQRVADHAEWFARFETALQALPDEPRQHSVLPLLHAFAQPTDPLMGGRIPSGRFQEAVGDSVPHITAALIHKYVTDLKQLRLL
ncbi:carboxylic acid reductase [Amycolatopsis sp. NPDC088138]|uniref:carboxylic acid reductase n=1 Tax=Amycolatopsis sp. NPDC088138 TaxID=3363938 RepID=UPI00381740B0